MSTATGRCLIFALILVAWHMAAGSWVSEAWLPPLKDVLDAFLHASRDGQLAADLWTTVLELLASLCIGGALGLLAGLVIGYYRGLSAVFYPLALVAFSVPLNVFAPQFVATLGFGIGSKIAFGATVCFWVVFFQMVSSVRNADQSRAAAVRQMGGRGSEVFLYVLVPMGVRYLVTGLRAASPYTLEVIVLAEIWGSTAGLGRMVTVSVRNVDVAATFVAIVLLATLGVLMSLGIDRLDRAAARKLEGVQ